MKLRDVLPKDEDIRIELITSEISTPQIGAFVSSSEESRLLSGNNNKYSFSWECIKQEEK